MADGERPYCACGARASQGRRGHCSLSRLSWGSLWAAQMKPMRTSGKARGDGAACLADEKLVEDLLANRCMVAVAEHVCCSLMLPQFSHDTAADLTHAGSGPTAAEAAQSGAGPSKVPAVNTCSPAHQLPAACRAALAARSCLGTRSEIEEQKVTLQDALH